jgi:hypothetical protein
MRPKGLLLRVRTDRFLLFLHVIGQAWSVFRQTGDLFAVDQRHMHEFGVEFGQISALKVEKEARSNLNFQFPSAPPREEPRITRNKSHDL